MTLEEKQSDLRERFGVIPDPQERLAALVNRRPRVAAVTEAERVDANLVPGCVSRVWLVGGRREGRLWLRLSAEAAVVGGLAAFVAELFEGSDPAEAEHFECTLLDDLGIARLLTPTRRHGLEKIGERIRAIARES